MNVFDEYLRSANPTIYLIVTAFALVTGKIAPTIWRNVKMVYSIAKTIERLSEMPAKLDELTREVKPNGGSSLRDAIDKTSRNLIVLADNFEDLALKHHTHWRMAFGIPSWESDEKGRCTSVNTNLCELVKRSDREILGNNWKNMIHSEDAGHVFSEWERVIREGADFDVTARYMTSDGEAILVRMRASAIIKRERCIGWVGTAERVTGE